MADSLALRAKALLVLAATLLLAVFLATPAEATWPGREGPIVYTGVNPGQKADENARAGLRSFTPGVAGSRRQLTTDPADRDPQVSPDGRLVVFSRPVPTADGDTNSALFVIGIDGSGLRQLTDGGPTEGSDAQPTFDASGKRVLFVHQEGGEGPSVNFGDIYSVGIDGSGPTPVTTGPPNDYMPAASPNGRQIAFVRNHYPSEIPQGTTPHLYSARPDGSRLRNLTPKFRTDPWDPEFSPSGRTIAFAIEGNQLRGDVFTLRSNGGPVRRLTNRGHGQRDFPRPYGYTNPTFSPTGDEILAVARSGTSPRLARIRLSDPDHPRLLALSLSGSAPAWAPAPGRAR